MTDLIIWFFNTIMIIIITFTLITLLQRLLSSIAEYKNKDGSYVLVTGCDSGFGYAISLELSKQNIYTFAGCLTTEGVQRLNEDDSFKGIAMIMDVTKERDIKDMEKIIEGRVQGKGLWCIINNAGIWQPGLIDWMSMDDMKNVMDVNLWGAVNVTKIMLPLVKRCQGRIINISSIAGRVIHPNSAAYSMSKFALEAFSDSLRYEMNAWSISVHIIEPGHHRTNIFLRYDKQWKDIWEKQPSNVQDEYGTDFYKNIVLEGKKSMNVFSGDIKGVIHACMHAALSSRPKPRYVVGMDACIVGMALSCLPTTIGDFLLSLVSPNIIPDACKEKMTK